MLMEKDHLDSRASTRRYVPTILGSIGATTASGIFICLQEKQCGNVNDQL